MQAFGKSDGSRSLGQKTFFPLFSHVRVLSQVAGNTMYEHDAIHQS